MKKIEEIKSLLRTCADIAKEKHDMFFKTGPGQYAEHDKFIGIKVPTLRKIAKNFSNLSMDEIESLLESPFNEERLFALIILVDQFAKADVEGQEMLYQFYMRNLKYVNNWNLVDSSAHLIVGAYLLKRDKKPLFSLAQSDVMWKRRIAIVSTWAFIRNDDFEWTFKVAEMLLRDADDLIHKAVGWMLREAGKRNLAVLIIFLNQHANDMPRTMLRYAIEKLDVQQRKAYLMKKVVP